jgi:hypothetical protein
MKKVYGAMFAAGAALVLGALPLAAAADGGGASVGVSLESLGYGLSLAYPVAQWTDIRVQSGNFSFNHNFNSNGDTYNGHLNLSNILITGEVHPLNRAFFIAAGGLINSNKVTATATGSTITVGGTTYAAPAGSSINANVTWNNLNPYIGIGFGPARGSGFGFDLGAAFQGKGKAVVTNNGVPGVTSADIASAQTQIQNTLNGFSTYPVVGVRYSIGF